MNGSVYSARNRLLSEKLLKNLEKRNFEAFYCDTAEEACEKALSLMEKGSSVAWGGSETVKEIGLMDEIKKGDYVLIDRDTAKTPEERTELMRKAFFADNYLTSVNAITEDGIMINVDGLGNRVAAMTFGPSSVIVVVGMNKVCKSEQSAEERARTYAPAFNAIRLGLTKTVCAKTGACGDCLGDECMCSYIVKTRRSKIKGRIKVILVGEELGY